MWSPLKVSRREDGGALILSLEGALTDSSESYAMLDLVREELQAKPRPILLNLAGVDPLTSCGIGVIASCHTSAAGRGTSVSLVGLTSRQRILLTIVHLLTVMPEFETEAAALSSLAARSPSTPP